MDFVEANEAVLIFQSFPLIFKHMFFFHNKSETFLRRMAAAKLLGLFWGFLCGFVFAPSYVGSFLSAQLQWGILLWGATFGAMIGLVGLVTVCPLLGKSCPISQSKTWRPIWRGGIFGAWLEFVLTLMAYKPITEMMQSLETVWFAQYNVLLLAAVEGFIVGAIIDFFATRYGGEGKQIL